MHRSLIVTARLSLPVIGARLSFTLIPTHRERWDFSSRPLLGVPLVGNLTQARNEALTERESLIFRLIFNLILLSESSAASYMFLLLHSLLMQMTNQRSWSSSKMSCLWTPRRWSIRSVKWCLRSRRALLFRWRATLAVGNRPSWTTSAPPPTSAVFASPWSASATCTASTRWRIYTRIPSAGASPSTSTRCWLACRCTTRDVWSRSRCWSAPSSPHASSSSRIRSIWWVRWSSGSESPNCSLSPFHFVRLGREITFFKYCIYSPISRV